MSAPAWSVVVPTYGRRQALGRLVAALSRLEPPPGGYEVVVVDDGSPVSLVDQIVTAGGGVDIELVVQANAGPGAARNRGVAAARGRFVAMTDDDCVPASDWLVRLHEALTAEPRSLVGGATHNAVSRDPFAAASEVIVGAAADFTHDEGGPLLLPSNNIGMARDEFLALGGFDPAYRVGGEDRDLCDRWHASGRPLRRCPDAVVHHHHAMDLGEFWRVHTAYGRGAHRYHRQRRARGTGRLSHDVLGHRRFLAAVSRRLRDHRRREAAVLIALVALAQVATVAGYVAALRHESAGARPSRHG